MAKAKKRITVRKKGSKRGKATTKPASKTAKRTPAKKSKSKVRRVGTEVVTDAHAKLEAMSADGDATSECIAAVAVDVASKRDEYRSIGPYDLAELLGIDDAGQPGADWGLVWFVPRLSVRDILLQWDEEFIPELLALHVTAERCEEISAKINLLNPKEAKLRRTSLDFLTEKEKETIERLYMERERKNGNLTLLAYYYISAPHGRTLTFEAFIGDNGESFDSLKTPYDERDGKFTDLSDCLIVEDRR
jgi:hypothetical protein